MNISPFFRNLRAAYRAELDDLTCDSDGRDVLRQRLAAKRKELNFLLQMMEISPEMVAVIFHQGFAFRQPAVMDNLLSYEADEFPAWREVSEGIDLAPWARELAQVILQAPSGEWFMTLAAGLHYMMSKPDTALGEQGARADADQDDDQEGDEAEDGSDYQDEFDDHESDEERGDARTRAEAGAEWMSGQGFDRKD